MPSLALLCMGYISLARHQGEHVADVVICAVGDRDKALYATGLQVLGRLGVQVH